MAEINKIQFKRGSNLDNAGTPSAGEPIYDTSTGKLYIGDGTLAPGGTGINTLKAISDDKLPLTGGTLTGDLNVTADGARLFVNSADHELVSIGRAGSSTSGTPPPIDQGYLRMKSAGTNKIALHTAGNSYINGGSLGLGTESPAYPLDIVSTINNGAALAIRGDVDADGRFSGIQFGDNGTTSYSKGGIFYEGKDAYARGNLHFALEGGTGSDNADLTDSKMTITYDNGVGIGTTTPATATNVLLTVGDTSLGYAGMEIRGGTNAESWRLYSSFDGNNDAIFGLYRVADSSYKFQVGESGNTTLAGQLRVDGGQASIYGLSGGNDAILELNANNANDNDDRWQVYIDASANSMFKVRSYATGSWVDRLRMDGANFYLDNVGHIQASRSSDPGLMLISSESNTDNWHMYVAGSGLKFRNTSDSNTALELTHANNAVFSGSITGATNSHISYSSGNATSTATGGALNVPGSDIVTGRLFLQGYQNNGGDLVGFNNEPTQLVIYNYTDSAYLTKITHGGNLISYGTVTVGNTYTLPSSMGSAGQVLKVPSSGSVLEWGAAGGSSNSISGDLTLTDYEPRITLTKTRDTTESFHIAHENGSGVLDFLRGTSRTARITNNGRWVIGGHTEVDSSQLSVQGSFGTTGNAIFGGYIRTNTNTNYAMLYGKEGGLEVRSSRSNDAGIAMSNSSGSFRFQLYGDGSNYGFLTGFWGSWDIKKVVNGEMTIRKSGSYYTVYDTQNLPSPITASNIGSQSVASATNADTVDSLHASSFVRTDATSVIKSGNAFQLSPDADSFPKVNMDARTSGDGARLHKWNRNNADSAYLAYYENWYDGSNYGSFGHDGGKWVFNQQIRVSDSYGDSYFGGNQGDEWGRIEFSGYSNGVYVYTGSGSFRVDGGNWNPYDDSELSLGTSSLRWNLIYGNQYYAWNWFRAKGSTGLYFQDYGGGWHMTDSSWIRSYGSKYVYIDSLLSANTLNVATSGGISPTQHDNTPLVGSKTNNVARFNGSIHLDGNNDSISFGSGTATFLHDEELGFGWGGGIYMTDGDWVRIRNAKNVYASSGHFRGGRFSDGATGSYYVEPNSGSAIKLNTTNGYVQIGPMNSSYCHYNTDRAIHWFNVKIEVQGDCNPHIANSYALGSESKRWQNLYINNIAKVGQLKLNNSFVLRQGSSDYGEFTSWLQGSGGHGIYFPSATATSSPHIYPNNGYASYGTFRVTGHTGGYPGIIMGSHSYKPTFMVADSTASGGLYYSGTGRWAYYHNYGHNCLGIGSSTTSSSYELYVHGDVYATGSYSNSDIRMKENIETIDSGIEKVMNMRGVYFDWINKEKGEGRQTGVIAQELAMILPEAVVHAEDIDEYSVDYSKITGVLIEAIKDLKNEINELKKGCCNGFTEIN